jgi:type I restriction enzyme M protein
MLNPMHYQQIGDPHSGLRKFPAVVANPPFNLDFSSTRDAIASTRAKTDRFFAGVPTIPKNKKDSMAIYLLFIQHILYVMEDDGIAAIVLPSGFLTKTTRIEKGIKKALIDNHWLKGVVTMPSNIFANTATSVSILFIDKKIEEEPVENEEDTEKPSVVLIDASHLGHTVKDNGNQRTILSADEERQIIDTFQTRTAIKDFSVVVPYDELADAEYSLSPGQYFPVSVEHEQVSEELFETTYADLKNQLDELFAQSETYHKEIQNVLGRVTYCETE